MKSAIGNLQVRDVTLNKDYTITVTPCYTCIYMRHVAAGCKSFEICSRMPRECYWQPWQEIVQGVAIMRSGGYATCMYPAGKFVAESLSLERWGLCLLIQ